uniref:Uncharacterized protein n=1 Tax=Oryza sativa subsp. japonica TaxID=39947 RepID=Q69QJ2_ORYSJ|nr:hypothetical protein [Oryza sativa Japonica Group]
MARCNYHQNGRFSRRGDMRPALRHGGEVQPEVRWHGAVAPSITPNGGGVGGKPLALIPQKLVQWKRLAEAAG